VVCPPACGSVASAETGEAAHTIPAADADVNLALKESSVFTRDEALAVWDDLVADKDAFLVAFGEVVFVRHRKILPRAGDVLGHEGENSFGYFVRARNHCYTKEMFEAYNRICQKHGCTYRIETEGDAAGIVFFKESPRRQ
jgi:hypothetical protein